MEHLLMLFKSKISIFVSLLILCSPISSYAAGSIEAGKQKNALCAACHGADGVSLVPLYPNLAGQVPGYIAAQLASFKSGERVSPIMAPFIMALTDEDMADLDAFYASLDPVAKEIPAGLEEVALEGQKIYRGGFAEREIASCMSCHGPSGHGIPTLYPRVSAQSSDYLQTQLLAFKKGERTGYNDIMSNIAFSLSEQQISALAIYMSGLN
jgi:cytochrome c553